MSIITNARQGSNTQPPAIEAYEQMMKSQLISAIKNLKRLLMQSKNDRFLLPQRDGDYSFSVKWARDGWLPLDIHGKEYLKVLGINDAERRVAVNAAHRAHLIQIKIYEGVSYIALSEKETR